MENKMSGGKISIIVVVGLVFIVLVVMFAVVATRDENQMIDQMNNAQNNLPQVEKIEPAPEDQIEFADPGDDEIGQEVKELDALINDTMPSEYDESGLSEDVIEGTVELQ